MADILAVIDKALAECAEPTQGDQVIAWAEEHLDVTLTPWQEEIIRRSFDRLKERGQAREWTTSGRKPWTPAEGEEPFQRLHLNQWLDESRYLTDPQPHHRCRSCGRPGPIRHEGSSYICAECNTDPDELNRARGVTFHPTEEN